MEIQAGGAPAHTRTLEVRLAQDAGNRLRARGAVVDLRKRGLVPMAGDLQTNGFIHHMRVDATLRRDGPEPVFETIRADQPTVAFEPSAGTGGECCRDPVARIEALAGSTLDAGFARRLGAAIGGPLGCSHVLTAAQLLGSTVRTALDADLAAFGAEVPRAAGQRIFERSLSIDGLEDGDRGLSLSLQLADVHFAPVPLDEIVDPLERLAAQHEIRVHADVDLGAMTLRSVGAGERTTTAGDYQEAPWRTRDLAFLDGHPALGGMAGTLFAKLSDAPADRPLLDALLNLAPAVIQCIPALTHHWKRWREAGSAKGDGGGPSMMAGGGMVDSCYMWRADGFLHGHIAETMKSMRGGEGD
ncbi:MAG: DUF2889 domain-containing protein [Myxococcota bacterium]